MPLGKRMGPGSVWFISIDAVSFALARCWLNGITSCGVIGKHR